MFLSNLKPVPRALVILAGVGAVVAGANWAINNTKLGAYVAPPPTVAIAVPEKIVITNGQGPVATASQVVVAPDIKANGTQIRVKTIPWNGTLGMMHAKASGAFEARGLSVDIKREDDYAKLTADMADAAKDPSQGSHFVVIMGDGLPGFIIGLNDALKPYGAVAKMIGGIGYSRGEDKCIISDTVEPRGSLIKGYFGDGDINICIKYAADNGIPVNADPKVYDKNAMNLSNAGSFTEADNAFIASAENNFTSGGSCEDRRDVTTGKQVKVCITGTATWTPGDSNVFNKLKAIGKSIRIIGSTKEYAWQMPTAVIGNKAWMDANPDATKAFLAAIFESGAKVRGDSAALMVAAAEQARVTGEQDASYWASMFKGVTEMGPNGKPIALGGSTTNGLADAAYLFGLNGADDLYKKVYTVYGKIAVQYFSDMMPGGLRPYETAVDKSYVQALLAATPNVGTAATTTFTGATTETFAVKPVSIEFDTGKATFTPKAAKVLNDLLDQAAVTNLSVQINGHTDSVGDPTSNLALSKARAEAVKHFLMTNAPKTFPAERVATRGFGDTQPIGTNAQNRRVEIILRK